MDNLNTNQAPVGVEGATFSQDNAGIETQPSETDTSYSETETVEDGQAQNPWDNDPKFKGKTPEDIYKAYKEAEKLTGHLSQKAQIANLIEKKYGITPEEFQERIAQQEIQRKRELYAQNPLAPVIDEVQELRARIEQQDQQQALANEEKALDSFLKENPDYSPHKDKLMKLALTKGIGYGDDFEKSYEELAREWIGEIRAQGQNDAYKKIEVKKQQATPIRGQGERHFNVEDLKKMSSSELKSILPHADTSSRL